MTGIPSRIDVASLAVATAPVANATFTDPNQTAIYNGFDVAVNARLPGGLRIFGGTTTERTLANTCDLGVTTPTTCSTATRSNLGNGYSIPWKTQFKLSWSYPLPFLGIVWNGTYQALPGYTEGASTLSVTKNTTYTTCPGTSAAAGCVRRGEDRSEPHFVQLQCPARSGQYDADAAHE